MLNLALDNNLESSLLNCHTWDFAPKNIENRNKNDVLLQKKEFSRDSRD